MKPEQLLVIASARGIRLELGRPRAQIPLAHRGKPRPRRERDGDREIPGVQTAAGRQSRAGGPREWTATDLGLAAAGMPKDAWHALSWCIALEETSRVHLKHRLLEVALQMREREAWPKVIKRGSCGQCGMRRAEPYIEDLCVMATMEGAFPQLYRSEAARAKLFGMPESSWRRHASKPYQAVFARLNGWYESSLAYLRRRLHANEEVATPTKGARRPA